MNISLDDLKAMTVKDLRSLSKGFGLSTTGNKSELVRRIYYSDEQDEDQKPSDESSNFFENVSVYRMLNTPYLIFVISRFLIFYDKDERTIYPFNLFEQYDTKLPKIPRSKEELIERLNYFDYETMVPNLSTDIVAVTEQEDFRDVYDAYRDIIIYLSVVKYGLGRYFSPRIDSMTQWRLFIGTNDGDEIIKTMLGSYEDLVDAYQNSIS